MDSYIEFMWTPIDQNGAERWQSGIAIDSIRTPYILNVKKTNSGPDTVCRNAANTVASTSTRRSPEYCYLCLVTRNGLAQWPKSFFFLASILSQTVSNTFVVGPSTTTLFFITTYPLAPPSGGLATCRWSRLVILTPYAC